MTFGANTPDRPRVLPGYSRRRFTIAYAGALVLTACLSTATTLILHNINDPASAQQAERTALAAILITLLLEALLIFLPLERRLARQQQSLADQIAEQARVESEMRQSEMHYRLLARNLPDLAIMMFDRNLRYTLAEGQFLERAGFRKEQLEGASAPALLSPEAFAALKPLYDTALSGETMTMERAVGDLIHFTRSLPVRDERGDVIGGMILSQDVTQQRRIEAQLLESEAQYRSLFDHSLDAVMLTNPDGRILKANAAACRMLGYSEEEITTLGREGIVDTTDPRLAAALEERALTGSFKGELTMIRRGGQKFPVEVSTQTFTDRSSVPKTSMVLRDISERKLAEQRRIDLVLEREKVRLLSNFVSSTSHDLRTPLSIISTNTYLCRKGTTPEQQHVRLDNIDEQVKRLNEIIEQLHQMASLDGTLELRRVSVDISDVIGNVVEQIQADCDERQLRLEIDTPAGLPAVQADPRYLKDALVLIARNAVQYTPAGGVVSLITARDSASIRVTIRDTGIGISAEHLPHIFERFYKIDQARSDVTSGAGLGLTMAKRIIEEHQGTIGVESQPGTGTCVYVRLPLS